MAIKKYVAISYCFAFLFVYLSSIAYALISTSINTMTDKMVLPQTQAMNATSSALSSFGNVGEGTFMIVGLIIVIIAVMFLVNSVRAMGTAI